MLNPLANALKAMLLPENPGKTLRNLFLFALVYKLAYVLIVYPNFTHWFSVNGVPYSDAARWYNMALAMAEGKEIAGGWSAQRPGYAFALATLFSVFCAGFKIPIAFNLICSALSVPLIFAIIRKAVNPLAALVTAFVACISPVLNQGMLLITTESLGLLLLLIAIYYLFEKGKWTWVFAGIFIGFSELSRPLAMGLIPLLVIYGLIQNKTIARRIWNPALIIAGFLLVVSPWILRQYHHHGFWGVTDKTYESLYATSEPDFGQWNEWIQEKANQSEAVTIPEKINFFKSAFLENISNKPVYYIKNISNAFYQYFNFKNTTTYLLLFSLFLILQILLLASWVHAKRKNDEAENGQALVLSLVFILILFTALIFSAYFAAVLFILLALIYGAYRKKIEPLFILLFIGLGITLSLVNESRNPRFMSMVFWMHISLTTYLIIEIITYLEKQSLLRTSEVHRIIPLKSNRVVSVKKYLYGINAGFLIFLILGGLLMSFKYITKEEKKISESACYTLIYEQLPTLLNHIAKQQPHLIDTIEIQRRYNAEAFRSLKDDIKNHGRLWYGIGKKGSVLYEINANQGINHSARIFQTRDYNRQLILEDYFSTQLDSKSHLPDNDSLFLLINRVNADTSYIQHEERMMTENLAMVPITSTMDFDLNNISYPDNQKHLEQLQHLQRHSINRAISDNDTSKYYTPNINFFNLQLEE